MKVPLLQVQGLGKSYLDGSAAVAVLNDIHFTLEVGSSLAITGPSGSGKSTLLNILAGLLEADAGVVVLTLPSAATQRYDALSSRQLTRLRRRHIGYIYQFFNLVPTLTVLENVLLPLSLNRRQLADRAAARARAHELLTLCGVADRLHAFPETLSGGESQRVAVARALVLNPALVLADEPTGNLDGANAAVVANLLFEQARAQGASVVIATHSDAVAQQADQHLVLGA